MPRQISADEVEHFQHHGFVVVEGFLDRHELARALVEVNQLFPSGGDYAAMTDEQRKAVPLCHARPLGPLPGAYLNQLMLEHELLSFTRRALEIDDPVVVQAGIYAKYQANGYDGGHHVDYGNNELAYPSRQPRYGQVSMMMYFDEVTPDNAPTRMVSLERTRDMFLVPNSWSREGRPDLYANEVAATCSAGSLLLWGMRTVHRASQMANPSGRRVHNGIVYASASSRWIGMNGWGVHADGRDWNTLVNESSREAREALGFPPPGHDFWDEDTIAGTAARYPRFDPTPYREALSVRTH
jgi:hypothetical protein